MVLALKSLGVGNEQSREHLGALIAGTAGDLFSETARASSCRL